VKTTYSISGAQSQFPRVVRETAEGGAISITRHDETVAYVVSRERMDAIVETMEILANPAAARAIVDYRKGATKFKSIEALDDEG
jgi:prevent-host-death family protein